jgi:uncharacterized membrane protein YraQ (UPF0718 family)
MSTPQTSAPVGLGTRSHNLQVLQAEKAEAVFRYEVPTVRKIPFWSVAGFIFLFAAVALLLGLRGTSAGTTLGVSFVSIILEALPFVILGSLASGIIEVFVPKEAVARLLPQRKLLGILAAASLGLIVPVCECAVIPFTRRLVRKGVPFSTAVAYLLAGPTVNVLTGSSTLLAYHNPMARAFAWHVLAARTGFAFFIAVVVALIIDRLFPGQSALIDPAMDAASCACGHDHDHDHEHHDHDHHDHEHHDHEHAHDHEQHHHHHEEKTRQLFGKRLAESINHAGDDFLSVGQFLVIGAFVAAICQTIIPREAFVAVAHAPGVAILVLMGLAVALNLCSGANAFVAASFRGALPLSAQMGFMLLGPMLDTKLSAMYLSFISKRAFVTLLVLVYAFVFSTMMIWHYVGIWGAAR